VLAGMKKVRLGSRPEGNGLNAQGIRSVATHLRQSGPGQDGQPAGETGWQGHANEEEFYTIPFHHSEAMANADACDAWAASEREVWIGAAGAERARQAGLRHGFYTGAAQARSALLRLREMVLSAE